jgi:hypothetical protein
MSHDQAWRTVTDQPGYEQAQSQARARPLNMDGHCVCERNGFPRRVPNVGDAWISDDGDWRMADRPQTPKDVSAMGLEPQSEELL